MKGVVFTEYLEFIEDQFGFDVVDDMIEQAGVSGVYTQAGNYEFDELLKMVQALSAIVDAPLGVLVGAFAKHLFKKLVVIYPEPTKNYTNAFEFISNIDSVVHPEVQKLYPDAELPTFDTVSCTDQELVMKYRSKKPLMDLAQGLMEACGEHYNEDIIVSYSVLPKVDEYFEAQFTITKG